MAKKTAWDRVLLARKTDRPKALDYINKTMQEFSASEKMQNLC